MQFLASLHRSVAALTTPGTADTITTQDASSRPRAEAAAQEEEQQAAPSVPPRPDFGPQAAGVHAAAAAPAAAASPAAVPQALLQQQAEPVDGGQEQPPAELPAGYNPAVEQLRQQEFRRLEGRVYAGKLPPPPARWLPGGPAYRSSRLVCRHCCELFVGDVTVFACFAHIFCVPSPLWRLPFKQTTRGQRPTQKGCCRRFCRSSGGGGAAAPSLLHRCLTLLAAAAAAAAVHVVAVQPCTSLRTSTVAC